MAKPKTLGDRVTVRLPPNTIEPIRATLGSDETLQGVLRAAIVGVRERRIIAEALAKEKEQA